MIELIVGDKLLDKVELLEGKNTQDYKQTWIYVSARGLMNTLSVTARANMTIFIGQAIKQ